MKIHSIRRVIGKYRVVFMDDCSWAIQERHLIFFWKMRKLNIAHSRIAYDLVKQYQAIDRAMSK